jgi:hypothetical protein
VDDQVGIVGAGGRHVAHLLQLRRDQRGVLRKLQTALVARVFGNDRERLSGRGGQLALETGDLGVKGRCAASQTGEKQRHGNQGKSAIRLVFLFIQRDSCERPGCPGSGGRTCLSTTSR